MKKVVFTFGRMNPPTTGHQLLVNKLVAYARQIGAAPRVYLSHSVGAKDPLQYDKKVSFARAAFGSLVKKSNARTVIEVLKSLEKEGYTHVTMFAGSDRVPDFTKLLTKYNGNLYNFESIEVKSAGERDPDADDVSGMSASKMRALAKDDNLTQFLRGAPNTLKVAQAKNMFTAVRRALLGEDVMDYAIDEKFISYIIENDDHEDEVTLPSDSEIEKAIDGADLDLDDADALMLDLIVGDEENENNEMNEAIGRRWKDYFTPSQDWQHTRGSGGGLTYKIGDEDPSNQQNIMVQLMKVIDRHGSIPISFKDGTKMNISSPKAQRILGKLRDLKPIERAKAIKDKTGFVNFVKSIHEEYELEETVLSLQTRQKLAQRMKGMSKRLARLRQIKAKQMPASQRLRMRARKAALMILRRRATGKKNLDYNSLSRSQRIAVDNALVNRFGKGLKSAVEKISKRLIPAVRKKAQINVSKARDIKEQTIDPKKKTQVPDQAKDSPLNLDALKINVLDTDPQKNDRVAPNPERAHLHKNRKATHFKTVDEGRKSADDKDARDAGDTNIIYQMRKVVNSRGEHETVFADKHKANISVADAKKLLAKFEALRLPADKHEFTIQAGASLAKFRDVLAHGVKHQKKGISLGGKKFNEFYLGVGRSRTVSAYDNDEPPGTRRIAEVAKDEDRPEDPNRSRPLSQKMDLLMRLGLVDSDELQKYRRALRSSKKFALQSPELRMKIADLLDKLIDLTTKDPATYSRVRYNVMAKEALSLMNKAEKSGVDVDIIFEVFSRGYNNNEDINEAFARVNSFIAGGKAAEMDKDLSEKRGLWDNIHAKRARIKAGSGERMRKPGSKGAPTDAALKASQTEDKDPCWSNYKQVGMKMKNGRQVPNCVPKESVYPERHAAAKKILGKVAKDKGGKVGFQSTSYKDGKKVTTHGHYNEKGERVVTHTTSEENVNENKLYHVSWGPGVEHQVVAKHGAEAVSKAKAEIIKRTPKLKDKKYAGTFHNNPRVSNLSHERKAQKKVGEETQIDEISSGVYKRAMNKAAHRAMWDAQGVGGPVHKKYSTMARKFQKKGIEQEKKEKAAKTEGFVVKYHDDKGKYKNSSRVFTTKDKADAHAARGNKITRVGGKYTVHQITDKGHEVKENETPLSSTPVRGIDSSKSTKKVFEQNMTTHEPIPLAKRAKRVKSFHAWHPKPTSEAMQRHADIKMIKVRMPDGSVKYRKERPTTNVQQEMYTGSEPVSGNRADPANRFVGTNAIRQNYASVTPGQGSAAGEIAVAKFAPEKVDYSSSMVKKTRTEVDQSKEDMGQKNLAAIRKALGGIRESVELNESFAAGFELAPLARDYGIQVQSSFQHHPEVQEALDAQEDTVNEAIYQGRQVQLNKPMKGDVKKSKVYVRDPSTGNIKKVNFGDKNLSIKKDQPARKRSYCARSGGQGNLTKKTSANYWSRRAWNC